MGYCAAMYRLSDLLIEIPSIRKSLLVFGEDANTAFASEDHFIKIVDRYESLGITELIFFYPFFAPDQAPIFEKIAKEAIPKLRNR